MKNNTFYSFSRKETKEITTEMIKMMKSELKVPEPYRVYKKYKIKEETDDFTWTWNGFIKKQNIYDPDDVLIGTTQTIYNAKELVNYHLVLVGTKPCPRCQEDECGLTCSPDMDIRQYFIDFQENQLLLDEVKKLKKKWDD